MKRRHLRKLKFSRNPSFAGKCIYHRLKYRVCMSCSLFCIHVSVGCMTLFPMMGMISGEMFYFKVKKTVYCRDSSCDCTRLTKVNNWVKVHCSYLWKYARVRACVNSVFSSRAATTQPTTVESTIVSSGAPARRCVGPANCSFRLKSRRQRTGRGLGQRCTRAARRARPQGHRKLTGTPNKSGPAGSLENMSSDGVEWQTPQPTHKKNE